MWLAFRAGQARWPSRLLGEKLVKPCLIQSDDRLSVDHDDRGAASAHFDQLFQRRAVPLDVPLGKGNPLARKKLLRHFAGVSPRLRVDRNLALHGHSLRSCTSDVRCPMPAAVSSGI